MNRVPPHNHEAEQAILGTVLASPRGLHILEGLTADDFYSPAHRTLFDCFQALQREQKAIDLVTVKDALEVGGTLNTIGGPVYLMELAETMASPNSVSNYVEIVKQKASLRLTIDAGVELVDGCYETQDVTLATEQATRALSDISSRMGGNAVETSGDICKRTMDAIVSRKENPGFTGLRTGFHDLDAITNGLQDTDLILLAARPSMGKTTLGMNIAKNVAVNYEQPVGVFSLEMGNEQIMERMLSHDGQVPLASIKNGSLSEQDMMALYQASDRVSRAVMRIDDTGGLRVGELKARARQMKRESDIKLLVVDYLGLMKSDKQEQSREREVGYISAELKSLAKELRIPVIALSQLNRSLEQRTNKRPMPSDLRDSGSLEQDADIIMFIYRDAVYNTAPDNPAKNEAEVIIAKHRNGRCGTVYLYSQLEFSAFQNMAQGYPNEMG